MSSQRVLKYSKKNNPKRIGKKKVKRKQVIMICIVFILAIFNIILIYKHNIIKEDSLQIEEETQKIRNEKIVNKLADMNERERMEYYIATFVNYIESKEYEKAYELLYDEFRQRYFPTLEDFTKYAEETFPTMMNIEHDNIERNGEVYVLWIYVSDILNGEKDDKKAMNVVIKENNLNDFVLSFSVI